MVILRIIITLKLYVPLNYDGVFCMWRLLSRDLQVIMSGTFGNLLSTK